MPIDIKRVYEDPLPSDGKRVLVDRLWPRGLAKERAALDLWLKEVAPTTALRKWFAHDERRWEEFQRRYRAELDANPQPVGTLAALAREHRVTLLFSTAAPVHHALVLRDYLAERG